MVLPKEMGAPIRLVVSYEVKNTLHSGFLWQL